jgi:hypothetical protein
MRQIQPRGPETRCETSQKDLLKPEATQQHSIIRTTEIDRRLTNQNENENLKMENWVNADKIAEGSFVHCCWEAWVLLALLAGCSAWWVFRPAKPTCRIRNTSQITTATGQKDCKTRPPRTHADTHEAVARFRCRQSVRTGPSVEEKLLLEQLSVLLRSLPIAPCEPADIVLRPSASRVADIDAWSCPAGGSLTIRIHAHRIPRGAPAVFFLVPVDPSDARDVRVLNALVSVARIDADLLLPQDGASGVEIPGAEAQPAFYEPSVRDGCVLMRVPIPSSTPDGSRILLRHASVAGHDLTPSSADIVVVGFNHVPSPEGPVMDAAHAGDAAAVMRALRRGHSTEEQNSTVSVHCPGKNVATSSCLFKITTAPLGLKRVTVHSAQLGATVWSLLTAFLSNTHLCSLHSQGRLPSSRRHKTGMLQSSKPFSLAAQTWRLAVTGCVDRCGGRFTCRSWYFGALCCVQDGATALMCAAYYGHLDVVKALVAHGAAISTTTTVSVPVCRRF